jgi:sulfoxide reductase heme-binding subunit YedZ
VRLKQWIKPGVFLLALTPLAILLSRLWLNKLGANPIEFIIHDTGTWALRFVLITLAVTPLYHWTHWSFVPGLRRMLGLFAFFYATLHLLGYVVLDQYFAWDAIWADVFKRPYITVGFAAFVLLIALALTSFTAMMRRLKKRWKILHRSVYVVAILALVHVWWLVKSDLGEVFVYAVILAFLLGWRVWKRFFGKRLST